MKNRLKLRSCSLEKKVINVEQRFSTKYLPFKRQPHKMVKHTQIIRRLLPTNCLSAFDHFVVLALKGLNGSCSAQKGMLLI